jgi:hypothetical protein
VYSSLLALGWNCKLFSAHTEWTKGESGQVHAEKGHLREGGFNQIPNLENSKSEIQRIPVGARFVLRLRRGCSPRSVILSPDMAGFHIVFPGKSGERFVP